MAGTGEDGRTNLQWDWPGLVTGTTRDGGIRCGRRQGGVDDLAAGFRSGLETVGGGMRTTALY